MSTRRKIVDVKIRSERQRHLQAKTESLLGGKEKQNPHLTYYQPFKAEVSHQDVLITYFTTSKMTTSLSLCHEASHISSNVLLILLQSMFNSDQSFSTK